MAPMPDVLRRSINNLTLDHEFFASLLLEMRLKEVTTPPARILGRDQKDKDLPFTMGTDGTNIYWSRDFVNSINIPVCIFALVHEVCHPMLMHIQRIYQHGISGSNWSPKTDSHGRLITRDPTLFNVAGDYLINALLKEAGFKLWDKCLYDPKYTIASGWTTEKVYDDLLKQAKQQGSSLSKSLASSPTGCDLIEPSPDTDIEAQADEWKERIVRAAAIARSRGTLPGSIESLVREITEPQYPVYLLLERYVDSVLRDDDFSFRQPNRAFMNVGIIMPGPYSERVSRVDVWYDVSGSVSDADLSKFHRIGGDIIRNAAPQTLALGQCDAAVTSYTEIRQATDWPSEVQITGRGGTSFQPPFTYLRDRHITPSLLIYLTDLEGDFPTDPPPYPVLWVSTTSNVAPFGTTIHLNPTR